MFIPAVGKIATSYDIIQSSVYICTKCEAFQLFK